MQKFLPNNLNNLISQKKQKIFFSQLDMEDEDEIDAMVEVIVFCTNNCKFLRLKFRPTYKINCSFFLQTNFSPQKFLMQNIQIFFSIARPYALNLFLD